MNLDVFDVEHGQCALLTCDNGVRMMIDCGHSRNLGWSPGEHLRSCGVDQLELLTVTNYDEDHVSGLPDLLAHSSVGALWRNTSVSAQTLKQLKTEDGYGPGIDALIEMIGRYTGTYGPSNPEPTFAGLKKRVFYSRYPAFDDENNLSMAVFLECHGKGVLFTGDLEIAGWRKLLEQADFRDVLRRTDVLMASHHGRANGCCEEVFEYASPFYAVISDCGYKHDTQQTVPWYRARVQGGPFRGENRHVLTTRRDGTISFTFGADSWGPY